MFLSTGPEKVQAYDNFNECVIKYTTNKHIHEDVKHDKCKHFCAVISYSSGLCEYSVDYILTFLQPSLCSPLKYDMLGT